MQVLSPASFLEVEDMALSLPDKEWIRNEIRGKGWRRLIVWAKEWGALPLIGGAIIIAFFEWNHFTNDFATFSTKTKDRLDELEKLPPRLDSFEKELQRLEFYQSLKDISSSDPATFSRSLPDLRKILQHPVSEAKPSHSLLLQLASKLRETSDASPDYWPTVLEFIQFASSAMTPPTDVPPPGPPYTSMRNSRCGIGPGYCGMASHRSIVLDGGDISRSRFENCRIIFTQNPVKMRGVQFINCVFEMPVTSAPTPYLKDAARQLLASNLTSVSIPSS
jgi:hypothetical protein